MVSTPDFISQGPGFKYHWWQNSGMALHWTEPFIITLSLSQYNLNNFERDIKHQIIVICLVLVSVYHLSQV